MKFCVNCGRIMEDDHKEDICLHCKLTKNVKFMRLVCPECGKEMEIFYKEVTDYIPGSPTNWETIEVDLIYHCDGCTRDWDSHYTREWGDEFQSLPKRHYWG